MKKHFIFVIVLILLGVFYYFNKEKIVLVNNENVKPGCLLNISQEVKDWKINIDLQDGQNNEILIFNSKNELVQNISTENNWDSYNCEDNLEGLDYIKSDDDINFDGYNDLRLFTYGGASIVYFDYYIFNPQKKIFELVPTLNNISSPRFIKEKRQIISGTKQGVYAFKVDIYDFVNGRYELTESLLEEI